MVITHFGKELRKLRVDRDEILKNMADKLGITSSYLSAIECGKRNIPDDFVSRIVNLYNLTDAEELRLNRARENSLLNIELNLTGLDDIQRELCLNFSRKYAIINEEDAGQIIAILRGVNGSEISGDKK